MKKSKGIKKRVKQVKGGIKAFKFLKAWVWPAVCGAFVFSACWIGVEVPEKPKKK